jgi:beta-aspartyl-peptidase (threonine type)
MTAHGAAMKTLASLPAIFAMMTASLFAESPPVLVIHGGAGITRAELSAEKEAAARKVLEEALRKGHKVLTDGGTSMDAVTTAIVVLEDSPLFNAGRGSVLTSAGAVEMDASVMDGATRAAGTAASIQGVKNPILLARRIMEDGRHVTLSGRGAEDFAREAKLAFEPAEYFITPERTAQLQKWRAKQREKKSEASAEPPDAREEAPFLIGTVGAVALDKKGHLAAGTSTGGRTGKLPGRVGDSPVIGAGTYAEDGVVAVSCTGHGEFFMRMVVAHDVAARMKYQSATVAAAAEEIIQKEMPKLGGTGGLIAVDAKGNIAMPFNTEGMFRASLGADGTVQIAIFGE